MRINARYDFCEVIVGLFCVDFKDTFEVLMDVVPSLITHILTPLERSSGRFLLVIFLIFLLDISIFA